MSTLAATGVASYRMHDVDVSVITHDPDVQRAMELRLRSFTGSTHPASRSVRLEFITHTAAGEREWSAGGRPVYDTPHGSLHYDPGHDLLAGELGGVSLSCDATGGHARIIAEDFRGRSLYFATHPVATVALMELLERRRRFSLHAACLADSSGSGILICGPSGAGKSTLTLALARTELDFLADDTVFLQADDGSDEVRALAFPDALGIGEFAARRFPELAAISAETPAAGFPKRLHRYEDVFGRAPALACIPRVIVFPEVDADAVSAVIPLEAGEGLLRLVPDVLLTNEASTREHVAAIGRLLSQTRCFAVRAGRDLERAAELVGGLLH